MRCLNVHIPLLATCFQLVSQVALLAESPERWADPALKVTAALEVWLDADRQNAARKSVGKPQFKSGDKFDVWHDGSGQARHVSQKEAKSQPIFLDVEGRPVVRFDGEDDHLTLTGLAKDYREATIFIVAAPFSNPGMFRAFMALNKSGQNDYVTGLTIDQGAWTSTRFETLNPEGNGFGGALDLMSGALEFGTLQRIAMTTSTGRAGTKLYLNGKLSGQRDRTDSVIHMDQLTVGARFYTNGGPPIVRGFLEGAIAEVLVYGRVLTDDELKSVDGYLAAKHGDGRRIPMPLRPGQGKPLVTVSNPPPVQVFVPGFSAWRLPLELPNINNLRYRADGKLMALGYDGNVWLLSDTDEDGLEDKAVLFWDNQGRLRAPIGTALTPPRYAHGNGLFVASKGKCSLIVDTDGDDKADKEIVVASGWQELAHNVDALGVAFDPRDGSVYFGLGTADFTNAYQVKENKAQYNLSSERGTVLRVSPDFKSREIFCTGIRFPVGLAFNRAGDLFCTDQEGATWLANGNPWDELLHLEKGRHYGFPPRHPRHLPAVIDEPSLFDYAPQHQSLCGVMFNEAGGDKKTFGPAAWQGEALICGYSRGKLYRTKLAKSLGGYVARNQLWASLDMLTSDACLSPRGDLVVSVHSGGPDWGSGPSGKGRLYQLRYVDTQAAQPVAVWPQGPREVRIAFDRAIAPEQLRDAAAKIVIEYGKYVAAGDRFEVLRPGYQVVQDQLNTPRHDLALYGLSLTADRRTLLLSTANHPQTAGYAITLPRRDAPGRMDALPQHAATDLAYDLSGVETSWQAASGESWTGWLPHLDLAVSRTFTAGSAMHDDLWAKLRQPGKLRLKTKLKLWQMLRPAVQPGSRIDYEWPTEEVTVRLFSNSPFELLHAGRNIDSSNDEKRGCSAAMTVKPTADTPVPVEVALATGGDPRLSVVYYTQENVRWRPLPLHRMLLPWAPAQTGTAKTEAPREIPELAGGNWARGRRVFFGQEAGCAKCHLFNGQGSRIGPDLSNLPHRDYHSVLRDIATPSFAINPDYVTSTVQLRDGRALVGVLRTVGDKVEIGDKDGKVVTVGREEIEKLQASALSIMPEGFGKQISPEKTRDLMTFLLTEPPRMRDYGPSRPPPPRSRKEVERVLAGAPAAAEKTRPLRIVLVAGRKDHGPGEHDYPAWLTVWRRLLSLEEETTVSTAMEWPGPDDLKAADVLVFYQQGRWTPERAKDIDAFLARGGGLVYVHYAVDGGADAPGFAQRIGLAWRGGQSKFRHGPLDLDFSPAADHPVARNFDKVHFHDESYWQLAGDPGRIRLLASGKEDGRSQPLFWTLEHAKGRVFVSILGHYSWTFDDPLFRILLLRGVAWSAREPVDRFNELAMPGARIE